MDALKKCTVEDKMREAVGRTNGRSVADARGSGARASREGEDGWRRASPRVRDVID
jgi:hypothetical protein